MKNRTEEICGMCGGSGEVPVTYSEAKIPVFSNERAMELAGQVHHHDICPECDGEGFTGGEEDE